MRGKLIIKALRPCQTFMMELFSQKELMTKNPQLLQKKPCIIDAL